MTIHQVPTTREEILAGISSRAELATATGWDLAALLSAVVRLKRRSGQGCYTPIEFAALGFRGLRSKDVVTLYVQRWLDANDGEYLEPGDEYEVPEDDWPSTALEDSRYQAVEDREAIRAQAESDGTGASKAIDIAKNTKAMMAAIKASPAVAAAAAAALPPEVLAIRARSQEVAEAIHDDHEAATTYLKTSLDRSSRGGQGGGGGGGRSSSGGGMVSAIEKALMQLGAIAYENTGRKMLQNLQARHESELPWRPGELERLTKLIDGGIEHGQMAKTLLGGLSAEDLAELLGQGE